MLTDFRKGIFFEGSQPSPEQSVDEDEYGAFGGMALTGEN
jgi:hypothetical protein